LCQLLAEIPEKQKSEPGANGEWAVKDIVAHLVEWHNLMLGWYETGVQGEPVDLPAPGYKWSETPALNQRIFEKYKAVDADESEQLFTDSHQRVMSLINQLREEEINIPGTYAWTGKLPLFSYLKPCTAGHYRWAYGLIRKWWKMKID